MLHFGEIPKKIEKFGENSANFGQIWTNLRNFGEKTAKKSAIFNGNFEIRERCNEKERTKRKLKRPQHIHSLLS